MKSDKIDLIDKTWQETDEQIKIKFGNDYLKRFKFNNKKLKIFQQKDINQVAVAITKAVITKSPKNCYKCIRFMTKLYNLTPHFIWNLFSNSKGKTKAFKDNNL